MDQTGYAVISAATTNVPIPVDRDGRYLVYYTEQDARGRADALNKEVGGTTYSVTPVELRHG